MDYRDYIGQYWGYIGTKEKKTEATILGLGFLKVGVPFGGPHDKDCNILGSILGYPYFGTSPYRERMEVICISTIIAILIIGTMEEKMEATTA